MKILVLTTIYKDIDDPEDAATTPVVQNFAKEWVKEGHEVLLIHNFNVFPTVFYMVPQFIWDKLSSKKGFRTILNQKQAQDVSYVRDGVKVYRSTIKKPMPLGAYTRKALDKSVEKIKNILQENKFVPDVIISHMENPQIFQIVRLKKLYPNAVTSTVFHKIDYLHQDKYATWRNEYLPQIDKVGFRSKEVYRDACNLIGFRRDKYFMCPSGISEEFVATTPDFKSKFVGRKIRILYVGQFIPRKHVETIIQAGKDLCENNKADVSIELVGGGIEEENLRNLSQELKMTDVVTFAGRQPHNIVLEKMRQADIFVMVSEKEVFGLVYTEAMSQGCVVIASTEGGMEGIINDGINGYLSQAGDVRSLVDKIEMIVSQGREKNLEIAKASYNTALRYTEKAVAEQYLKNVLSE